MSEPLVSIIIPTYNRAHLIGETLDSVMAQTYPNWECIVVDDGSKDNTAAMMAKYVAKDSRFKYCHRPKDRLLGGNAARNYGFEVSNGDYIQWFDSDDWMLPEKLQKKVAVLKDPKIDFVVCEGAEKRENTIHPIKKWNLYGSNNMLFDHLVGKIIFGTNGPMFKRSFLKGRILFNETLLIKQEWEFFNRLLLEKPQIGIINKVLYLYRVSGESKRGTFNYKREQNKIRVHRMVFEMLNGTDLFSKNDDFYFRKYFQRLFLYHYKLTLKHKKYKDTWFVLGSIRRSITMPYLIEVGRKIFKNPTIIKNIFKTFRNG